MPSSRFTRRPRHLIPSGGVRVVFDGSGISISDAGGLILYLHNVRLAEFIEMDGEMSVFGNLEPEAMHS